MQDPSLATRARQTLDKTCCASLSRRLAFRPHVKVKASQRTHHIEGNLRRTHHNYFRTEYLN